MFKSVFAKYETAFLTIITFGFALLLILVTTIVNNYSSDLRIEQMESATDVGSVFVESVIVEQNEKGLAEAVESIDKEKLQRFFGTYVEGESLSFFLTDLKGEILLAVNGKNAPEFNEGAVSDLPMIREGVKDADSQYFLSEDQKLQFCLSPLKDDNGTCFGWLVVCSHEAFWGHMAEELSKTIITAALLVLLATMIAAYFITARTTEPLREMNSAARRFAAGQFDARVQVRGRDEVSELAEAFNQMAESLESLETMRNSFIANVSHDLRTPMTTIAGFIDGIRDNVIPPEEQDRYLEIVSKEVQRLSRLVSALLDLSRIQAGDRKFVMKPFDVCEMARVILISFERQIDQKHLEVSFEATADRMMVNADHDAIYQVFYNLCHNAVKFSAEGGVLRVRIEEQKGKKVQVSVYNEGQGIPPSDLHMVFERFYKSDKSRGLDKNGIGLGLFISKTIINAHGETIRVESEYGKNCEFTFTLAQAPHGMTHGFEG